MCAQTLRDTGMTGAVDAAVSTRLGVCAACKARTVLCDDVSHMPAGATIIQL
jgi:hypothetical protein